MKTETNETAGLPPPSMQEMLATLTAIKASGKLLRLKGEYEETMRKIAKITLRLGLTSSSKMALIKVLHEGLRNSRHGLELMREISCQEEKTLLGILELNAHLGDMLDCLDQ